MKVREITDESNMLLSDYIGFYLKSTKNKDFTTCKISFGNLFNQFIDVLPDITEFNSASPYIAKERFNIDITRSFKYMIEKLMLQYTGELITSMEENKNIKNIIDTGTMVNILEDYADWLKFNDIDEGIGMKNKLDDFIFRLKDTNTLNNMINIINKSIIDYSITFNKTNNIIYPLKWEMWNDKTIDLYYLITDYGSETFNLLDIKMLWDIDFKLIRNNRLLS